MRRPFIGLAIFLAVALSSAAILTGRAQVKSTSPPPTKRADVFAPNKLWTLHLKFGAKEYQGLTPKGGGFGFGFGKKDFGPPKNKEEIKKDPNANTDIHKNKAFGTEFPWVKGDLEFAGKLVTSVGIRYKGNSTYNMAQQGLKRPFKIDVNHFVPDQKLHGLGGFALGNNIADPTRLKETLGFEIFRAAGVPAPRTAFVKLYLTVTDSHQNAYVGLYTMIEPVDKPFLRERFKSDRGMLLKPERIQGIPYRGESWSAYKDFFNPKRTPTEKQKRRLIEFARLVNQADDATFNKKIGEVLDVDNFLRFAAANSMIANLDSFFGLGHNYFLYLNPKTNKFNFIPWDLDLAFGGMGFGGPDQTDWSIAQPYMGKNRLTERVLAIKSHNDAYRGHLRALTQGVCSPKAMRGRIDALETLVKDSIAREPAQKGFGFGFGKGFPGGKKQDLRDFVTKRTESVVAQLDGKSKGKTIAGFNFGGFGGKKGPGFMGFGLGNRLANPILEYADKDKNGKLSLDEFKAAAVKLFEAAGGAPKKAIEEKGLLAALDKAIPPPPGFGGFKPPPGGFKGFSPSGGVAGAIMKQGGAGPDKKLTQAQFLGGAERLFKQWDKNKNEALEEKELVDGINQFLPPPRFGPRPGFGPGPGDPKKDFPGKESPKEKNR
ncbi:MAG: CotH kinase family protein [Planctomycetes bacterium]|nr:CotH kinase family protein [Planctomycetota bacterium]